MTHLYQLVEEYLVLQTAIDNEELSEEDFTIALTQLEGQIAQKAENHGLLVKSTEVVCKAIDEEIKRLSDRKRVRDNRIARLKEYLMFSMIAAGEERLEFALVTVSIQKNPPSVEIVNQDEVDAAFIRVIPEQYEVNKKAILDYWKEKAVEIAGVRITDDKKRLVIK